MVKKDYNQLYDDLIRGIPEDMPADDVLATHYTAVVTGGGGMGLGFWILSIPGRWWSQLTRKV